MVAKSKKQKRLELPSEPEWDDILPKLVPLPGEVDLQGMLYGVRVPGGTLCAPGRL